MQTRTRECDVCGSVRRPSEIGPTMVYERDPETGVATYMHVQRCRNRDACEPVRDPEQDGRVVRRGGMLVVR